MLTAPLR